MMEKTREVGACHAEDGSGFASSCCWRSVRTLCGGMMLHAALGTVYCLGVTSLYFLSFIRKQQEMQGVTELVRSASASDVTAASFCSMALAMPLGGILQRRLGPSLTALIGGSIFALSIYLSHLVLSSWSAFCFLHGAMCGFGLGVAYTSPLVASVKCFPNHGGLVSGLITAGFGSGAAIFTPIQTRFVNPQALPPRWQPYPDSPNELYYDDPEVLRRVPLLLPRIAGVYFGLVVTSSLLMADGSFGSLASSSPASQSLTRNASGEDDDAPRRTLCVKDVLKLDRFWRLWISFGLQGLPIVFLAGFWRELLPRKLETNDGLSNSESVLSVVAALASVCNATGRILWGRLADGKGFRPTLRLLCASWVALLLGLSFARSLNCLLFGVLVSANFFCLGGNFSLFPRGTAEEFGSDAVGHVYGLVFTAQLASSAFSALIFPSLAKNFGLPFSCRVLAVCPVVVFLLMLRTARADVSATDKY